MPTSRRHFLRLSASSCALPLLSSPAAGWERSDPSSSGLDPQKLSALSTSLGGSGCVIRHGKLVHEWGEPSKRIDWYSSVKPLFSTLLWFAVAEGKLPGVDDLLVHHGWELREKDRPITFRHLASMTSGYARPEPPGAAWAYNDFAIQLYQQTLFDRVFRADPTSVLLDPSRLGPLGFEDSPRFNSRRRLLASPRDFARLAWFWLSRGEWAGKPLLPRSFFDDFLRPTVPADLPKTAPAETDDYLGIASFGGGSDHFSKYGPGMYGFNFWFNSPGRTHPNQPAWPSAPSDTIMTIGFGGNCSALFPSLGLALSSAGGSWGKLKPGDPEYPMNLLLRDAASTVKS
jgi:CubicO group peptidase (beta-lactamase class C family)